MQHLQPNTTLQGGKYRIERVLGQGGFGITYLAEESSLHRYVAIKELFVGGVGQAINERRGNDVIVTNVANKETFNQHREKFKKEAQRLASLNHPNLIKVHELFEENNTAYYVMDYIDGESLRTKLDREGWLSVELVMKYLQQLLSALEISHRQHIWHLDIKPENIMVDRYDHVYLIDFGASKHIEKDGKLTTSFSVGFTPGYYPPEQTAQTMRNIGAWTDIYALGATIYNLLTNKVPPSHEELLNEGHSAFSFPPFVSSKIQDLIVWMMEPRRIDRPQSVAEVLSGPHRNKESEETLIDNTLPKITSSPTPTPTPVTPPSPPSPKSSSNNVLLWIIGVAAIVVGIIWITSRQNDPKSDSYEEVTYNPRYESEPNSQNTNPSSTARKKTPVDIFNDKIRNCQWYTYSSGDYSFSYPDFMEYDKYSMIEEAAGEVEVFSWKNIELAYWAVLGYWAVDIAKSENYISSTAKVSNITYSAESKGIYSGYTTDGRIYYLKTKVYNDPQVPHATVLALIYPEEYKNSMHELTEIVRKW